MRKYEDEVGSKFGRLTIVAYAEGGHPRKVVCRCDCGVVKTILRASVITGNTSSCGCLNLDKIRERNKANKKTHGLSKTKLYSVWHNMHRRCYNPTAKDYKHYGGRGIKICDRWQKPAEFGFFNFKEDMEGSYSDELEIDRIEVNGDYSPDNCKWSTRSQQVINRRSGEGGFNAKFYTYKDQTLCLSEWARVSGIKLSTLSGRLRTGWDFEKAITQPLRNKLEIEL
jgi:hypothetical protein